MSKCRNLFCPEKIDLHMHSTVSDGTDTPEEILKHAREIGLELFSITDHDAVKAGPVIQKIRGKGDPAFITGVEFSCKDEGGRYHILGYGFDPDARPIRQVVEAGHRYRIDKVNARLKFLEEEFGFVFPEEETRKLLALDNPGKPHIGNLMTGFGYAKSKDDAIINYINKCRFRSRYVTPAEAIEGILGSGGIPVLAHPSFGNGEDLIVGEEMGRRLLHLLELRLQGVEAFYSGFSERLSSEILAFAEKHDLYVTAGSDYHGSNKTVRLGDTGCGNTARAPKGMCRFLERINSKIQEEIS